MTGPANRLSFANAPPKRALVMRVGALGDLLLTRRLTYSMACAGIRSTVFAPARNASLLAGDPWIEGIVDSEGALAAGVFAGEWEAGREFDAAVVISNSRDLESAAEKAAVTAVRISPSPTILEESIALQWAQNAAVISAAFEGTLPDLPTVAELALASDATVVHPGSGSPHKNWPIERFVELSHELEAHGHTVMWLRGPAEVESWPTDLPFAVLDHPSPQTLAATLSVSRLFLGNDSGVSHLSAAVGAPTLALFGPTNHAVWRPDGRKVCTLRGASQALSSIGVNEVLAAIDSFLKLPA